MDKFVTKCFTGGYENILGQWKKLYWLGFASPNTTFFHGPDIFSYPTVKHCITNNTLFSVSSYFERSLKMMKETCLKSFRTNYHWSRSVKADVRKRLMTLSILVHCARLCVCVCFITFRWFVRIFSFDRTRFFHLRHTRKKRYRTGSANRSNRPTKVSLDCTRFKFGICPQKHRAQLLQAAKWPCNRIS